jgi:hypothetical protein
LAISKNLADLTDAHPLPLNLGQAGIKVGNTLRALQRGEVGVQSPSGASGFDPNSINGDATLVAGSVTSASSIPNSGVYAASLRYGSVTGTVTTANTAVNTGAVGAGITPILYWVASGPVGAAIASYSGGANGTFSVNASATGTVTVQFIY